MHITSNVRVAFETNICFHFNSDILAKDMLNYTTLTIAYGLSQKIFLYFYIEIFIFDPSQKI